MSDEQDTERTAVEAAYEELSYEEVEVHENLSVPTSNPARFTYDTSPGVTNAEEIKTRFEATDIAFTHVLAENGEEWYEFSISAKASIEEHNESCRVSVSTAGVTILTKNEELSFETFRTVVETVEDALDTSLVPSDGQRESDGDPDHPRLEAILSVLFEEAPHPLRGRSYVQKLTFLLQREADIDGFRFEAGDYGPWARNMFETLDALIDQGYVVERQEEKESGQIVYVYESGPANMMSSSADHDNLREAARTVFDEYPTDDLHELLRKVYSDYPRMARNSVI